MYLIYDTTYTHAICSGTANTHSNPKMDLPRLREAYFPHTPLCFITRLMQKVGNVVHVASDTSHTIYNIYIIIMLYIYILYLLISLLYSHIPLSPHRHINVIAHPSGSPSTIVYRAITSYIYIMYIILYIHTLCVCNLQHSCLKRRWTPYTCPLSFVVGVRVAVVCRLLTHTHTDFTNTFNSCMFPINRMTCSDNSGAVTMIMICTETVCMNAPFGLRSPWCRPYENTDMKVSDTYALQIHFIYNVY